MKNDNQSRASFDDLRREIDGIDRDIHGLLMRRADVVRALGALKKAEGGTVAPLALRPGREAVILRRLASSHEGPFPLAALLGVWRSMIAAYLHMQTPFSVLVATPDRDVSFAGRSFTDQSLWDVARSHFGAAIPLHPAADGRTVIAAITADATVMGVVPPPADGAGGDWWTALPLDGDDRPRVIAALPAWAGVPRAYLLSRAAPEASGPEGSGDDIIWLLVRGAVTDPATILAAARSAGLDDAALSAYKADADGTACHLLATSHLPDPAAIASIAAAARGQAGIVGLFARPLSL